MGELVQINAAVPRDLKRRAFAVLALREERFSRWLTTQRENLVGQVENHDRERGDERLARPQARS